MKIQVLDKGFVELLAHLGNDLTISNSARVSFGKTKTELDDKDIKLIHYLAKNKHWSPFRQIQIQFRIKAPEFVYRQMLKHLVGIEWCSQNRLVDLPHNEISGRYVVYEPEFFVPEKFRKQSTDNKQATTDECLEDKEHDQAMNIYQMNLHRAYEAYQELLKLGVGREIARAVLPVSFYTESIVTMSLQAVVNLIQLRDHPHAQKEIAEYAKAFKELAKQVCPIAMEALLVENE